MRISYNWLKEYIDIKIKPEELADNLTMAGLEVTSLAKVNNDVIFEMEITPNRPDWLSIIGIAKEVSAVLSKKINIKRSAYFVSAKDETGNKKTTVELYDEDLCPLYTARIIESVQIGPSPKWLRDRIESMGLRSINNVVDITNFCLFELGQPLHAFDFDKLSKNTLIVRRAKNEESIELIDGSSKTLTTDNLVIADNDKPIAVAGIMGAKNTEVTEKTKNILLESAYFNPLSVRRTSRKIGISSESSYRFERGVYIENVFRAQDRATLLIRDICGGKPSKLIIKGKSQAQKNTITITKKYIDDTLGIDIKKATIKKIFNSLECTVKEKKRSVFIVAIPAFRKDLSQPVDLIEEIVRIYGYHNIPDDIPKLVGGERKEFRRKCIEKIQNVAIGCGLNEAITYSMLEKNVAEKFNYTNVEIISIFNPLSKQNECMRTTVLPLLLKSVSYNLNRQNQSVALYEIGNIYYKLGDKFVEKTVLSIALAGFKSYSWDGNKKFNYYDLKGIVEAVLKQFSVNNITFEPSVHTIFMANSQADVLLEGKKIGVLGTFSKELIKSFDIDNEDVYIAEIDLESVFKYAVLDNKFKEIPKFPYVQRDISIIVDEKILANSIASFIKKRESKLIQKVEIIDIYKGEQIPANKQSLAFSITYQDTGKTLTDGEVSKLHESVKTSLMKEFSAQIR